MWMMNNSLEQFDSENCGRKVEVDVVKCSSTGFLMRLRCIYGPLPVATILTIGVICLTVVTTAHFMELTSFWSQQDENDSESIGSVRFIGCAQDLDCYDQGLIHAGYDCMVPQLYESRSPCAYWAAPCSDHGECIDLNMTQYLCRCHMPYHGHRCEGTINRCLSNPCLHGNCIDEDGGYKCVCEPGYGGSQCHRDIDNCLQNPCGFHGTCIDLMSSYICICDPGYHGVDCHSMCDEDPCYYNATCSLCEGGVCEGSGLPFKCNCVDDFYGVLCTDRDGGWGSWGDWTSFKYTSFEKSVLHSNLTLASCELMNRTRTRNCAEPQPTNDGSTCSGMSIESEKINNSLADCECIVCCSGSSDCLVAAGICYCNELCRSSKYSTCCNNQTICDTETINP